MLLNEETAERILYLVRLGHPQEKGEPYTRGDMINEVERRGLQLLKDLKWKTPLSTIWKNRYTGHEERFIDLLNKWKPNPRNEGLLHELPFIIENWTPKDVWTDEELMDKYNPKATLEGWGK